MKLIKLSWLFLLFLISTYGETRPNILFLFSDDHALRTIGAYLDPLLRKKDNPSFLIRDISKTQTNGDCIYITPDAPHGPKYQINTNIYKLAIKYNMKLAILSFKTNRFFKLKNWDQLRIPLPFSKGIYLWGEKIIDANLFKSEEEFNSRIIKELNENKKIIESYV